MLLIEPGERQPRYVELARGPGGWWSNVFRAGEGSRYGFRVDGEYNPAHGLFHNRNKVLFDPYAKSFAGDLSLGDVTRIHEPYNFYEPSSIDSLGAVPLGILPGANLKRISPTPRPEIAWQDTVIYELNVKAATARLQAVPASIRGTYLGLAHSSFVNHLKRLGVTTLELLPVQYFADTEQLLRAGLRNVWGYSTISYFALDPRYATSYDFDRARQEFGEMVDILHQNEIEVILDVVYNHTGEGDISGPTFSYRGLAASSYYLMETREPLHVDLTGCGNTLNFSSPVVNSLVVDSLLYLANEFGVDGFRFDLATTLGRQDIPVLGYPFAPDAGVLGAIRNESTLSKLKLIAEPWDLGPHGYQRSEFGAPFMEWNDRFRDEVRRSFRPMDRSASWLKGTALHEFDNLAIERSINFVTCHDGFTLTDLVSYSEKHNFDNAEQNRDGTNDNYSFNWGFEGLKARSEIQHFRELVRRSLVAALILAPGVVMLSHGDELGRTQKGNNNGYCQDRPDYFSPFDDFDEEFLDFFANLIELRKRFIAPALRITDPSQESNISTDGTRTVPSGPPHGVAAWMFEADKPDTKFVVMANVAADRVEVKFSESFGFSEVRVLVDSATSTVHFELDGNDLVSSIEMEPFSVSAFWVPGSDELAIIV